MLDLGDNDFFICPRCGHRWEERLNPSDYEEGDDEYCCPECGFDKISVELVTNYWYIQNNFAEKFLQLRGYQGEPKSWYAVECYLNRFLKDDRNVVNIWKHNEGFEDAFTIVSEYFDKLPFYEYVKCKGCGKQTKLEDIRISEIKDQIMHRCVNCGLKDENYMVPCEIIKVTSEE